jgi:hypothetical protein
MATKKAGSSSSRTRTSNKDRQNWDPNYFVWPNPFWIILTSSGICLLTLSTFSPESIPQFLGPVGTFGRMMGHSYPSVCIFLFALMIVLHVGEAAYTGKVCHDRGMTTSTSLKWILSTFLFGFPSLVLRLLPHKPISKAAWQPGIMFVSQMWFVLLVAVLQDVIRVGHCCEMCFVLAAVLQDVIRFVGHCVERCDRVGHCVERCDSCWPLLRSSQSTLTHACGCDLEGPGRLYSQ